MNDEIKEKVLKWIKEDLQYQDINKQVMNLDRLLVLTINQTIKQFEQKEQRKKIEDRIKELEGSIGMRRMHFNDSTKQEAILKELKSLLENEKE